MLRCARCSTEYADTAPIWRCTCSGILDYVPPRPIRLSRAALGRRPLTLWRYREALPVPPDVEPVSLGEGLTPLVPSDGLLFKLDYLCPSGSFKDRGTAVLVTHLRRLAMQHVHEDSSGNAGASLATYCARAGIACDIYVPAAASAGKLVQMEVAGARVVRVEGPRENAARAALDAAERTFYASHNWSPFFLEGVATMAYELWEQLGDAPDAVVVPLGYGSSLLGCYLGFRRLLQAGLVSRLPRFYAAQAAACAPVVAAWQAHLPDVPPVSPQPTMAEGIASPSVLRGPLILQALRESGGGALAAGEDEMRRALGAMARRGFYIEPTSASAVAAAERLLAAGAIQRDGWTVVLLTGSGLKATDKIMQLFA